MASSADDLFAAIEAGDADRVRAIVEADPTVASARDEDGVSALMFARYRMDRDLTEPIAKHAGPLDVFEAASFGDTDRLTQILDEDPGAASARSGDGFTALHFAAFFGGPAAVRVLLDRGAEVDAVGTGWMTGTPLHSAASASHTDSAVALLEAGADPNARQSHGWTPLHSAAANGLPDLVRALIAHGADAGAANDDGKTAVDLADDEATRAALGG
jgi:ankyrin repeat protein